MEPLLLKVAARRSQLYLPKQRVKNASVAGKSFQM
jgi:hypothetical protein